MRPPSNDEWLRNIQHKLSYSSHYNGLLQNATDRHYYKIRQLCYYKMQQKFITKCVSFITKCDRNLLQNAPGFLLQNVTVITNCDDFITKLDSYYTKKLWYF